LISAEVCIVLISLTSDTTLAALSLNIMHS
jgi:hypothetical protein